MKYNCVCVFVYMQYPSLSLILIFSDPPSFLSPEAETLDIGVGDEITLNCTATGSPSPVYSWQSSDPKEKMEDQPVFTSSSLLPGTYTCISSNKIGKKSKQFIIKTKS